MSYHDDGTISAPPAVPSMNIQDSVEVEVTRAVLEDTVDRLKRSFGDEAKKLFVEKIALRNSAALVHEILLEENEAYKRAIAAEDNNNNVSIPLIKKHFKGNTRSVFDKTFDAYVQKKRSDLERIERDRPKEEYVAWCC